MRSQPGSLGIKLPPCPALSSSKSHSVADAEEIPGVLRILSPILAAFRGRGTGGRLKDESAYETARQVTCVAQYHSTGAKHLNP